MNQQYHCHGCGIQIQTDHPEQLGYAPCQALEKEKVICQRCFRLKHYNEFSSLTVQHQDFLRNLNDIEDRDALIVHILDIFDFDGSLIPGLSRIVGNHPVLLVVNKLDLLPNGISVGKLNNWVRRQLKQQQLKVVDVVFCSAKRKDGIVQFVDALDKHRGGHNIYVVGATNTGKSTLINRLIQDYSDLEHELTTSRYPGTTLDLVHIPLKEGQDLIDTPGVVFPYRLTEMVAQQDLQAIMPEQTIKPKIYQLNEGQSLFFGALARFDFVQGERQSFTCFVANSLSIHRTKLEKADELYENHKGDMLSPPKREHLPKLPEWTTHSIQVRKGKQSDISISGLGWIKLNGSSAQLEIHVPKGVKVIERECLI